MPFKSQAQRRKFAELLVKGEISPETFEEWNRETGSQRLPDHVKKKARKTKRQAARRATTTKARRKATTKTTRSGTARRRTQKRRIKAASKHARGAAASVRTRRSTRRLKAAKSRR
jgi:hypothetical protein